MRTGFQTGKRWLRGLLLPALCVVCFSGCEDSSDSAGGGGDDFMFGDNDPNVIVAMGDSVTAGSAISGPSYPALVAGMSGKTVINEGVGGALSSDGVNRLAGILERDKPGYVFILYGINDVIHVGSDDWTISNLRQMIWTTRNNQSYPIVGTIPPRYRGDGIFDPRHVSLNTRIRELCQEERVTVADVEAEFGYDPALLQEDGFHPNEDGNLIVATVFYEALP